MMLEELLGEARRDFTVKFERVLWARKYLMMLVRVSKCSLTRFSLNNKKTVVCPQLLWRDDPNINEVRLHKGLMPVENIQ